MNQEEVRVSLTSVLRQLDPVLTPWGFAFSFDGVHSSHHGRYASGHYVRGTTQIGISCRATLDNVYYRHAFVKQNACSRETEQFTIGHDTLMADLGHAEDCWLIYTGQNPDAIAARFGGERVDAFIHDLNVIASPVLREPGEDFYAIMRRGGRVWTIE